MPITRRDVLKGGVGAGVVAASSFSPALQGVAHASSDPFIGEIMLFAGTFAPRGWAFCDGQLLAISQNDALFSLIGTTYGGDGRTTFGLPDLRGRVPVHQSSTAYRLGQKGGAEQVSLTEANLPVHKHRLKAASSNGTSSSPAGNAWATATRGNPYAERKGAKREAMLPDVLAVAGASAGHDNMLPFQALHYCISLFGIYPSRH